MKVTENLKIKDTTNVSMHKVIDDGLHINANFHLQLFNEFGDLKDERHVHNTVTTAGKNGIAAQILASPDLGKPTHMELGTGSPSATKLGAYIASSRTILDSKLRTDAVITMVTTFGAGVGTGAVTEAGVFDNATQDTPPMWLSTSFGVVTKAAADTIVITWTLTVS